MKTRLLAFVAFLSFALGLSAQTHALTTAEIKAIAVAFQGQIEFKSGSAGRGRDATGKSFMFSMKKVGSGGFGDVFRIDVSTDAGPGSLVAKLIRPKEQGQPAVTPEVNKAIENLSIFQKDPDGHFLKYYGLITDKNGQVAILVETGGKDLGEMQKSKAKQFFDYGSWFHQITDGVRYMHHLGYGHFDLKPANMLIGLDLKIKIIDTDGAVLVTKMSKKPPSGVSFSLGYVSPEILNVGFGGFFSSKEIDWRESDIFSLGMTFLSLLKGESASAIVENVIPSIKAAKAEYDKNKDVKKYRAKFNKAIADGKLPDALKKSSYSNNSEIFKLILKMIDTNPTAGHRPNIDEVERALDKIYPRQPGV